MVAHYQLTSQQPQLQAMASRYEVHGPDQFKIRSWYRQLFCFPTQSFLSGEVIQTELRKMLIQPPPSSKQQTRVY